MTSVRIAKAQDIMLAMSSIKHHWHVEPEILNIIIILLIFFLLGSKQRSSKPKAFDLAIPTAQPKNNSFMRVLGSNRIAKRGHRRIIFYRTAGRRKMSA